jgi:hypothetical protein
MDRDSASSSPRKHANGWITVLALGLLAAGLLACLYVLIGFPAAAQETGNSTPGPAANVAPGATQTGVMFNITPSSVSTQPVRRQQLPVYRAMAANPVIPTGQMAANPVIPTGQIAAAAPLHSDAANDEFQMERDALRDELQESRENLRQAVEEQH